MRNLSSPRTQGRMRPKGRIHIEKRMDVLIHQSYQDLADHAATDRPKVDRAAVVPKLWHGFSQDVEPEWGVLVEST